MRDARLSFALETGALVLPDAGRIAVIGPVAGDDLRALPRDRVVVVTPIKPDYDHFAAAGYTVAPAVEPPLAAALVCLPRARAAAQARIAAAVQAVGPGGLVIVDGQKTDGIDSLLRALRDLLPVGDPVAKAHGRLFSFAAGPLPESWAARPQTVAGGFVTRPGVFSADGPDQGSALLAVALPEYLPGYTVDLGAGWGYLSRAVLARKGVRRLDVVEADAEALACARQNLDDPRAHFFWADATRYRSDGRADHVVMNPPFHTGRAADPDLGQAFLRAAAALLAPDGDLWLVANRHLPYDRTLSLLFRLVEEIGGTPAFRLTHATGPIRPRA